MKEVLFVCQANVGRSQMAEGFYNHLRGAQLAISAGVEDKVAKYNGKPRADIVEVMKEKGIDISHHTVKQVTEQMLEEIRTIVILCDPDECQSFLLTSGLNVLFRQVDDPANKGPEGVKKVRDTIEALILELIEQGVI